jgi:hypothetical protein
VKLKEIEEERAQLEAKLSRAEKIVAEKEGSIVGLR